MKILVVDDQKEQHLMFKMHLSQTDHELVSVMDGLKALEAALDFKPNVIFLDVQLPEINGIEILDQIKAEETLKEIPIFMLTGHTEQDIVQLALQKGAKGFMTKPLHRETLIANLESL